MTVTENIQTESTTYKKDEIKYAISNNTPLENKLNVVAVISNPCQYATRYRTFKEFLQRMSYDETVDVYVVELIYPGQSYVVTDSADPKHLQLKTDVPIWHKENMINLAVQHLLPKEWKAFAWVDGDLEFESNTWAVDTLKVLNGTRDIVQLFSHCVDMDKEQSAMGMFSSFGYNYSKNLSRNKDGVNFWHPGYAWAMTRMAYERVGGLYEMGILGSGDTVMALAIIDKVANTIISTYHEDYKTSMLQWQEKAKSLRLGYTPGVILHHYHGLKKNRRYVERWQILVEHKYSPLQHMKKDGIGILVPTESFTEEFKEAIMNYFVQRLEDDE